jgi:hypothetical protein
MAVKDGWPSKGKGARNVHIPSEGNIGDTGTEMSIWEDLENREHSISTELKTTSEVLCFML